MENKIRFEDPLPDDYGEPTGKYWPDPATMTDAELDLLVAGLDD